MPTRNAEYWEERAANAAADAEKMTNPVTRKALLEIAALYRIIAEQKRRLDEQAANNRK
jgi:hypothetical protein